MPSSASEVLAFNQRLVSDLKEAESWKKQNYKPSDIESGFIDAGATAQLASIAEWMQHFHSSEKTPQLGSGAKVAGRPYNEGIKIQNVNQQEKTGVMLGPLYGFEQEFAYVIVGQLPTVLRRLMYRLEIGHVTNRLLYLDMQTGEMIHNVRGWFTDELLQPTAEDISLTSGGVKQIGAAVNLKD